MYLKAFATISNIKTLTYIIIIVRKQTNDVKRIQKKKTVCIEPVHYCLRCIANLRQFFCLHAGTVRRNLERFIRFSYLPERKQQKKMPDPMAIAKKKEMIEKQNKELTERKLEKEASINKSLASHNHRTTETESTNGSKSWTMTQLQETGKENVPLIASDKEKNEYTANMTIEEKHRKVGKEKSQDASKSSEDNIQEVEKQSATEYQTPVMKQKKKGLVSKSIGRVVLMDKENNENVSNRMEQGLEDVQKSVDKSTPAQTVKEAAESRAPVTKQKKKVVTKAISNEAIDRDGLENEPVDHPAEVVVSKHANSSERMIDSSKRTLHPSTANKNVSKLNIHGKNNYRI